MIRCFVTDNTTRLHHTIADYDTRASVEPLIGEAQWGGLLLAGHSVQPDRNEETTPPQKAIVMPEQTLRTTPLRLLYVEAKIRSYEIEGSSNSPIRT